MCRVSIIIPYYNSENTIIRALESVIKQSYRDYEIILIDDGSTDNSHKIIDDFFWDNGGHKYIHLKQKNSGPSKARNEGVRISSGEYIAFLDSDDSWNYNKLELQMNFLGNNENIDILGCDYNIIIENSILKKSKDRNAFLRVYFYNRLFKNFFSIPTVIIKKRVFEEIGGFNEKQRYAEDSLLFMKILRRYNGGKIEKPLVNLYKLEYGESGLSSYLKESEKAELNNFKILRNENNINDKKINIILYMSICIFSIIKYIRRIIIIYLRRRSSYEKYING